MRDAPRALPHPHPNGTTAVGLRERLFAAARAVFAERGYDGATEEEIARRAACTVEELRACFARKEDLFLALLAEWVEAQLEAFRQAWQRSDPVAVNAQRVVERFVRQQEADPVSRDLLVESWSRALRDERVRAGLAGMYARWREFLVGAAAREVPAGLLPIAMPHLHFWASLRIAIQDGLTLQARIDPRQANLAHWRDHLAEMLLALFDRAMPPAAEDPAP